MPISDRDVPLFPLIRLLCASPRLTQRELAASLGMSLGKANYSLRALIARGFVQVDQYRTPHNKLAYAYGVTSSGRAAKAELARHFLAAKVAEFEALRREIEELHRETGGRDAVALPPEPARRRRVTARTGHP